MSNNAEVRNNGSNFLANIFKWSSEVVESAESPFARLAAFLLPILAPITPAFLTSLRLYGLFLDLTNETGLPSQVALVGAVITALVLEILGYVGTIAMVRFIYKWIKTKEDEYLIPTVMTGIAYVFYLGIMYLVNVQLTSPTPNTTAIFGLLGFLTIPAGLIFATNLVTSEEDKNDYILRQEKREDRLKSKALKSGINVFSKDVSFIDSSPSPISQRQEKTKYGSDYKDKVFVMLDETWIKEKRILSPSEITERVNKKYKTEFINGNVKGFWSRTTSEWKEKNNIT